MASFRNILDKLCITTGDMIYVHSSFSRLKRFGLSAKAVVEVLCEKVGGGGTIVMPSFAWNIIPAERPWAGYEEYLRITPCFDVLRTPCNMGWLAETFRNIPGTVRSAHGIWAVTAYGPLATEVVFGQELVDDPYGAASAFWRLIQCGAKLLGLGVTLNTSSLCPVVDRELGEDHTQQVFTASPVHIPVVLADGRQILTKTFTMTPMAVRHMNPSVLFRTCPELGEELIFLDCDGDFYFSYPSQAYHQAALRTGKMAIKHGQPVPWLKALPVF